MADHERRITLPQFRKRNFRVPVLALLLSTAAAGSTVAQPATPAAYPVAPDPSECLIDPAPVDEVAAILGTPVAAATQTATGFVPPAGTPADRQTSAEVVATLYQVFACANAGDPLRVASLFTEGFVRNFFGGVPREDLLAFLTIPPRPLPDNQKRIIIRFEEVQLLPDGRVGVVIVLDEPADPRTEEPDFAILKLVEGRWLVDEIHEDGGAPGTPTTGPRAT